MRIMICAMATTDTPGRAALSAYLSDPAHPERSQSALAKMLGINQSSISGWVRGTARPEPHLRTALQFLAGIRAETWDTAEERALIERVLNDLEPSDLAPAVDRSPEYDQTGTED